MNREERRKLMKSGMSKGSIGDIDRLNSPCTIVEAVQLATGVVDDALEDYQRRHSPIQLSMSIQIEILKDLVIKSGLITEEEYHARFLKQVDEVQQMHKSIVSEGSQVDDTTVSLTSNTPTEIEIKKES